MAITKAEDNLMKLLVSLDMEKELILTVTNFLETDEVREEMIDLLIHRRRTKGEVTEQDVLKAMVMLSCEKKEKPNE